MKDIKKLAEEYAGRENKKIHYKTNDKSIKEMLWCAHYYGFFAGVGYASQWNSPDEKPDRKIQTERGGILISKNKIIIRGFYDHFLRKKYTNVSGGIIEQIDGWQYLPSIK